MDETLCENHFKMKYDLNDCEIKIVNDFLKVAQSSLLNIADVDEAVKFLRAKKFNIEAAIDLFTKHRAVRVKENLTEINPFQSDVLKELLSNKFTFLSNCDQISGASICIFTVKLHLPSKTTHQNVLKALIFQLDAALTTPSVQRSGLIFVYDMNDSLYSNFDIQLSVKILNLLKGAYPARLCKVIIFTPPLWFRASFNFLRLFVREKLQDRIVIVTNDEELHLQISKDILPIGLGGLIAHSHRKWLCKAFVSMGYSDQILSQYNNNCDFDINMLKSSGSNSAVDGFCDLEYQKQLSSGTNGYEDSLINKIFLHEKSTTSSSSGVASLDCTLSPATLVNDDCAHSSDSSSSGQDSCIVGGSSDYEMLSVSSWDLTLLGSGDEDAMESEGDEEDKMLISEPCTVINSPNVQCSSVKSPIKLSSSFLYKVCVKRRNAERHDCKCTGKKASWALHKPDNGPPLHTAIILDTESDEGDDNDKGVTIEYFVDSYNHSIFSTMNEFRNDSIYGKMPEFTSYSNPVNVAKNRYSDIPCIEESRVKLIRDVSWTNPSEDLHYLTSLKPTDYIHANWVDGYRQKNAFICTQGPLSTTVSDFWHMIIQYRAPIIVMTTRPREQNRDKCYHYWPDTVGETKIILAINDNYDTYEVTSLRSKEFGPNCPKVGVCNNVDDHWYCVTLLHVKNCRTGQEHRVNHFYFHSWPDQGIPQSSEGFLHFILQIRQTYRLNIAKLDYESEMDQSIPPPPIVVHCSAGIGRTGTYVVTEICSKSLSDCGRFNLHQTMLKVRSQRYKCVQNSYQYLYCRNTIIDYAKNVGLLACKHEDMDDEEKSKDGEEEEKPNDDEEEEYDEPIEEASESD